jgi:ATPase subunit of ABC transporter with duplicated ATPase domains
MAHKPIRIKNVSLSFPHKDCFEHFTARVRHGDRVAVIGRNGSGKSTLLRMLQGMFEPSEGLIEVPDDVVFGYVPQVIEEFDGLSGGERLNEALTRVLANDPNVLLLDEPTNHLDLRNRRSFMRWLSSYRGTLIVVSHDVELIRTCIYSLWHIDSGTVHVFYGDYDDYLRERDIARDMQFQKHAELKKEQKKARAALQREQERSARGRRAIARETDRMARSAMKEKGSRMGGKNRSRVIEVKGRIDEELRALRLPEVIKPRFSLKASDTGAKALLTIVEGCVHYDRPLLEGISLSVTATERVAIAGDNGSGKSSLIKAILGDPQVRRLGSWFVPRRDEIGYLDQHYATLDPRKTVVGTIQDMVPAWSHAEVRRFLNDFLFCKNGEVNALVSTLSGGERARLSLAQIAVRTPRLLILDEIGNNLDLEAREHAIQVLKAYPGAMIIVSHDEDFLRRVYVGCRYELKEGELIADYSY